MSQSTSEKPPKESSALVAFISILVIVHFLFTLAIPFAFIYEVKPLQPLLSENAFNIWLCQPVFLAICLMVVKSTSRVCRMLVYVDVGLSILQKASIFLLYAIANKIG
jgi:hypothetical protein